MQITNTTPDRGELVHSARAGSHLYEVFKAESDEAGYGFIGYHDGKRSVAATSADVCIRALHKKHEIGLPKTAEVIDFQAFRLKKLLAEDDGVY